MKSLIELQAAYMAAMLTLHDATVAMAAASVEPGELLPPPPLQCPYFRGLPVKVQGYALNHDVYPPRFIYPAQAVAAEVQAAREARNHG
jgi:hypothetical protein